MAQRPLLRGNRVNPAAALLLSFALAAAVVPQGARGEEAGGQPKAIAPDSAVPSETKPDDVMSKAAEPKETKPQPAEAKKADDAKPGEAKGGDAKPFPQKETAKPAEPRETRTEKPRDLAPKSEDGALVVRSSTIDALYRISWMGVHIGDFRIRSTITNRQYSLQANADISVFLGTFTWQGAMNTSGLMTANGPAPQNYMFRYATGERRETIELRFQQKMVQDISINPPRFQDRGACPSRRLICRMSSTRPAPSFSFPRRNRLWPRRRLQQAFADLRRKNTL